MNNKHSPDFTDEDILTIYIIGITEKMYKLKHIYNLVQQYMKDWFPRLPSYQAFVKRLNNLSSAWKY